MYRVRDFEEERTRTLYVRLPHRIRDPKEVQALFDGDPKVKLPRQASRACHVIFPSLEEKVKAVEKIKTQTVDGKRIVALNPRTKPKEDKVSRKKVVVPQPKPRPQRKITQNLFVSNIEKNTTMDDLMAAFPGSISVTMLGLNPKGFRAAFVKMDSIQVARGYVNEGREVPVVRGNKLSVNVDTRIRKTRRGAKSKKLKVYDGDGEAVKNKFETLDDGKKKKKNAAIEAGGSEADVDAEAE